MSNGMDYDISEVRLSFRKRDASKLDAEEKISTADSFVTFLSSALGAGVLSLPLSFAYAGYLQTTFLLLGLTPALEDFRVDENFKVVPVLADVNDDNAHMDINLASR